MQMNVHKNKIMGRIKKYPNERVLLHEILIAYNDFYTKCTNIEIIDENSLCELVNHTNDYLILFTDEKYKNIRNNSQSKIYPSILEEFMAILFKDVVKEPLICGNGEIKIGSHSKPYNSLHDITHYEKCFCYDTTTTDFTIGLPKKSLNEEDKEFIIPVVIIENKRYADKTMRGTIENTASKVKRFYPFCKYFIVSDILKGFYNGDYQPETSNICQIYGLRNNQYDDRLRPEVVLKLFNDVINHLIEINTYPSLEDRYQRGYIMDKS